MKKHGFSAAVTALVIAIVVVVNLAVGQLPSGVRELDMSDQGIYTVTQTSIDYLQALQEQVSVTILQAKDDVDPRIVRFLERYVGLTDKVTVRYVDPIAYPSAPTTYGGEQGDMVVSCAATGRSETVSLNELIGFNEFYYYYYGQYVETDFDVEGRLTSAIDGVVGEVDKTVYVATGHGESELSAVIRDRIEKLNLACETVSLMQTGVIPDDCAALLFDGPTSDLTAEELTLVRTYLSGGGQVTVLLGGGEADLPNLTALLGEYGLQPVSGYIADPRRYYQSLGTPYAIYPQPVSSSALTYGLTDSDLTLMYQSRGFAQIEPERDTVTVQPFLTTSDQAVAVTADSQETGSYILAAQCVEEGGGQLTAYSSASFIDEEILSAFSNVVNSDVFITALTAEMEDIANISIPAKSLEATRNTVRNPGLWGMLFIAVIPLATLAIGLGVWLSRRKR